MPAPEREKPKAADLEQEEKAREAVETYKL